MHVNLFFLKDKILAEGTHIIDEAVIEELRKDLVSGIIVIRRAADDKYMVSVNKYVEEEVRKVLERGGKNAFNRLYKIADCRESVVIEAMVKRLEDTASPACWNEAAWLTTLSTGVHYEYADSQGDSMLDHMVYKGRLQYESYSTYCLSVEYLNKMFEKEVLYMSWLERYLECKDESIINAFMLRHGYERKGKKFTKKIAETIGFLL